jgi:hypothetical protein
MGPILLKSAVCALRFFSSPPKKGHTLSQNLWLSKEEMDAALSDVPEPLREAFYFHATPHFCFDSILLTKKINVMYNARFPGAFVAMRPNTAFGDCIFGFRKNIEYTSPVLNGYRPKDETDFWPAFSKAIPVVEETLACIILAEGDEPKRRQTEEKCLELTGRKIPVYLLFEAKPHLEKVHDLMMGIPSEWPESSL